MSLKKSHKWKISSLLMILLTLLLSSAPVYAESQAITSQKKLESEPINPEELENFVDNFLNEEMEKWNVPGLIITVVQDNKILLSKGYGYADLENKIPMTTSTQVRAGSVSKPVTASAVLELVARGQVDLDAPVSDYIKDIELTDDYGEPSTVAQLLNHMSGYPDQVVQSHAPTFEEWQPLGEVLAEDLPERTLPPGKVMSYSSWDYALLGYVIEQVTGQPYEEAIDQLLLSPLDMGNSTYLQPLPEQIYDNLAVGYGINYRTYQYDIIPHDFVRMSPGVALVTTGEDMGNYMRAVLNGGVWNGTQAIEPEAVKLILEPVYPIHPYSRGRSYAFAQQTFEGRQVIYHDGNGIGFMSRMVLMPEQNLGIFISINHRALWSAIAPSQGNTMVANLSAEILKNFVPESDVDIPEMPPLPSRESNLDQFEGHYQIAHLPSQDFFKLEAMLSNVDVKNNGDGTLQIGSGTYVEVEPLVFQNIDWPSAIVVFVKNEDAEIEFLTYGGTGSYRKAPWYQNMTFQIILVSLVGLVSLSMLIAWPFTRQGHWLALVGSLLNLALLVGVTLIFSGAIDLLILFKTIPLGVKLLLVLPYAIGILSLGSLVFTVKIWQDKTAALWSKVHYTLVPLVSFGLVWAANFWNFILR